MGGMFDAPKVFEEHYQEEVPFVLTDMKEGQPIKTKFGAGTPTLLLIDGEWYSIFSVGIANQVDRMEDGDLPREVKVVRVPTKTAGNEVKLIVPAVDDSATA